MSTFLDPATSIEGFAELSARLNSPFESRTAVLQSVGLDLPRWQAIEAAWTARFAGPQGEALAERFRAVYKETQQRTSTAASTGGEAALQEGARNSGFGFLTAEAQPWRAEAARVGRVAGEAPLLRAVEMPLERSSSEQLPAALSVRASAGLPALADPLAGTADADLRLMRPALPFSSAPEPGADPARERVEDPAVDKTLDAAEGLPRPALPFVLRETSSNGVGDTLPAGTVLPRPDRTPRQS